MKQLPKKSTYDIDYDLIDRLFPHEGSIATQTTKPSSIKKDAKKSS